MSKGKKKKEKKSVIDDGIRNGENIIDGDDENWEARARKAEGVCEEMKRDWAMLNELLNTTARAHGWCGEYEDRLATYNRGFAVLQLSGRESSAVGNRSDPCWHLIQQLRLHGPGGQASSSMTASGGGGGVSISREEYERRMRLRRMQDDPYSEIVLRHGEPVIRADRGPF